MGLKRRTVVAAELEEHFTEAALHHSAYLPSDGFAPGEGNCGYENGISQ